jgi:Zn-dependent protease with chaperone function
LPNAAIDHAAIPGPVDRESFFAAQARNRRTTWRLTAVCCLAVLLLGVPLSAVLSPLIYGMVFLGADFLNLLRPTPDLLGHVMAEIDEADRATQKIPGVSDPSPEQVARGAVVAAAVLVPPGALALLLAFFVVRALFLRSGVGGVFLSLGAREPRSDDLEERQLVNVVTEMAIAAGVRPPRVMLLDTPAPNAAAVGSSIADGVVVVSRGLLETLDRDETQGIIGHLIGSLGNGDLRIATTMLSLFQTVGLAAASLSSPFGRESRATLWRLVRWAFRRRDREGAEALTEMLGRSLTADTQDIENLDQGRFGKIKGFFLLPYLMAYMAFWLNSQLLGAMMLGPLLALVWRTRRYLADATAVQLTRDPDSLARALQRLGSANAAVPGAGWASYLFAVWPRGVGAQDSFASKVGLLGPLHPAPERRLKRLAALGATVHPSTKPRRTSAQWALQEEIASTENKIAFARQFYNDAVMELNTARESFPASFIANAFGFQPAPPFEIAVEAERAVPQVQL